MRPSAPPRTSHGVMTCSSAAPVHSALPCQVTLRHECCYTKIRCTHAAARHLLARLRRICGLRRRRLGAHRTRCLCRAFLVCPACLLAEQASRSDRRLATQRPQPRSLTHLAARAPLCSLASASTCNAQAACHCLLAPPLDLFSSPLDLFWASGSVEGPWLLPASYSLI